VKYDAIIFDFDGVILESVDTKTSAFSKLYESHGERVQKAVVMHHVANAGIPRFEKIAYYHSAFLGVSLSKHDVNLLADQFADLVFDAVVASPYVKGAEEFLRDYSTRIPCYVASATPTEELQKIIDIKDLTQYFKAVLGSPRKKAELIKEIMQKNHHQSALMIGDSINDYDAAVEAEVSFLGRLLAPSYNPFPEEVDVVNDLVDLRSHVI
jgi:phosphoglycolate phosphatase-like HAD superfamily hydrolase